MYEIEAMFALLLLITGRCYEAKICVITPSSDWTVLQSVWCVCVCVLLYPLYIPTARINVGRIAALLAYCYHLVRTYIGQHVSSTSVVSFLAMVSGWLFQFLIKAKFYEWLRNQGGWVS